MEKDDSDVSEADMNDIAKILKVNKHDPFTFIKNKQPVIFCKTL